MTRRQNQNEAPRRAALYAMSSQLKPLGEIHELQVLVDRSTTYYLEHGYIVSHNQLYSEVRSPRTRAPGRSRPTGLCSRRGGEQSRQTRTRPCTKRYPCQGDQGRGSHH